MGDDLQDEPEKEKVKPEEQPVDEHPMADEQSDAEQPVDEQSVDELEQKLMDAVRSLNRKNKMIEEYLDNLARSADKPKE